MLVLFTLPGSPLHSSFFTLSIFHSVNLIVVIIIIICCCRSILKQIRDIQRSSCARNAVFLLRAMLRLAPQRQERWFSLYRLHVAALRTRLNGISFPFLLFSSLCLVLHSFSLFLQHGKNTNAMYHSIAKCYVEDHQINDLVKDLLSDASQRAKHDQRSGHWFNQFPFSASRILNAQTTKQQMRKQRKEGREKEKR